MTMKFQGFIVLIGICCHWLQIVNLSYKDRMSLKQFTEQMKKEKKCIEKLQLKFP